MMRVLIAGVLGAVAMFVWTSIAHVATPLATIGFSKLGNERAVLNALNDGGCPKTGLYFFPWVDPNDPKMMDKSEALMKTNSAGLIACLPPGASTSMAPMLMKEFAKELAQSLIAALLLSLTVLLGYAVRVGFVALLGVFAALGTDTSYMIWYGFPLDYTLANVTIALVGAAAAGLVIAAIVRPRPDSLSPISV